jgi:type IV pilus assembly protein PilW
MALLSSFGVANVGSRHNQAMAQMTEDASTALGMVRSNLAQAGFNLMTGTTLDVATNTNKPTYKVASNLVGLMGCDAGFTDRTKDFSALGCGAGGGNEIAIAYYADPANALTSGGNQLDCLGAAIPKVGGDTVVYNLFYVSGGALHCRGVAANAGQPLVDNIDEFQVTYLVQAPGAGATSYYGNAAAVGAGNFGAVTAVRLCVVVKSAEPVQDADEIPYLDCAQATQTRKDRFMRRAFTTTVALQNRLGVL